MTLQRRIDKARNKLAALLAYASCSLGTDLHDSETWPTECGNCEDEQRKWGRNCYVHDKADEPITTEYELSHWYMTNRKVGE